MANDKQNYINGGINEYLLGSEYIINKIFWQVPVQLHAQALPMHIKRYELQPELLFGRFWWSC